MYTKRAVWVEIDFTGAAGFPPNPDPSVFACREVRKEGKSEDHLHLVVTMPPTLAPSKFIGQVKAVSSLATSV